MAKINIKGIKKPTAATFRSWTFVLVAGVVLAILAMIDSGGFGAGGSGGCRLAVRVDGLNVRVDHSDQSESVRTLPVGEMVDGTREVRDGFRKLGERQWAWDNSLTPLPGTSCG